MVKIWEAKKRKLRKKRKLNGNRGKFRNFNEIGRDFFEFCGNRGCMQNASLTRVQWTPLHTSQKYRNRQLTDKQ